MHVQEAIAQRIAILGSQNESELLGSAKIRRLATQWWHGTEHGSPLSSQDLLTAVSELCRELEGDGYIARGSTGRFALTASGKEAGRNRFFAALSNSRLIQQMKGAGA